jgi:preprotein translocase subunit SecY
LIFAGIVIGLPRACEQVAERLRSGDTLETLGVIRIAVWQLWHHRFHRFCRSGRRKVPVSYAKRHVGRQLVGGQQTPCR